MQADPDKIGAISEMATSQNKAGVQRFLGTANYLSTYCLNLSTVILPLTLLTQSDTPFMWEQAQYDECKKAKHLISPVLQYYDLNKSVTLQVDAS